ncbi:alpha/beta-hydrolase, partial [Aaosphaeria arxii CBS 175.79]
DFTVYGGPSEEWLAVEKTLPATSLDTSIDPYQLRETVNKQRAEVSQSVFNDLKSQVHVEDYSIPTRDGDKLEARSYRSVKTDKTEQLPIYLYFHGGGFIFGSIQSEDAVLAKTAIQTGVVVLHVNYRHTPEHVYPTAWLDAQDAFVWLHKNTELLGIDPEKVVIGGVSAGAQLTEALVLEKHLGTSDVLNGLPQIAGQILIIPPAAHLDTYAEGPAKKLKNPSYTSYEENEFAPLLPRKTIDFFINLLKVGKVDFKDPKLNPVNFEPEEVKGLPPTVFGIAGLDPLRDEGLLYAKLLSEAGVPTDTRLFKGVPHGFRRFGAALKASEQWDLAVEEGIHWALSKPAATGKFDIKV